MTRFPKVSILNFVTMTAGLLALLACTNPEGTETFVDGPMRGRTLVDEELGRFYSETSAQDLQVVVMHPKCAKDISGVLNLSVFGPDSRNYGGDFQLRQTGTVSESVHRRQTFLGLRTSDYAKFQGARWALDEWVRLAQSGVFVEDIAFFSLNVEAEKIDVNACIPGQNTGSFVLMNRRTGERAVEMTLLSEYWD